MLFGGTEFFIDKFYCDSGEGILWLHGYGNVFEKNLSPREQIDVEHYRDSPSIHSVTAFLAQSYW